MQGAEGSRGETFRPDLEGLRGLAILLVLAFHASVPGITGGYIGVDVFFVLSGFLITGLLLRERERTGRIDLPAFYARRARRILPAAAVVIVATLPFAWVVMAPLDLPRVAGDAMAAALSAANMRFAATSMDYFAAGRQPLAVPALLVAGRRRAVLPGLAGPADRGHAPGQAAPQRGRAPDHRDDRLVRGRGLAHRLGRPVGLLQPADPRLAVGPGRPAGGRGRVGRSRRHLARRPARPARSASPSGWLAGWGCRAWVGRSSTRAWSSSAGRGWPPSWPPPSCSTPTRRTRGVAALLPTLGSAALILSGTRRFSPGHLLVLAPMRWLGRISFSLYLVHWPILDPAGRAPAARPDPDAGLVAGAGRRLDRRRGRASTTPSRSRSTAAPASSSRRAASWRRPASRSPRWCC